MTRQVDKVKDSIRCNRLGSVFSTTLADKESVLWTHHISSPMALYAPPTMQHYNASMNTVVDVHASLHWMRKRRLPISTFMNPLLRSP